MYPACSASLLQSWRSLGKLFPFNTDELHLLANFTNRLILSCTLDLESICFPFCFRYLLITLWNEAFKSCCTKKKKYDIGPKRQLIIFTLYHYNLRTLASVYGERYEWPVHVHKFPLFYGTSCKRLNSILQKIEYLTLRRGISKILGICPMPLLTVCLEKGLLHLEATVLPSFLMVHPMYMVRLAILSL